MKTYYVIYGSLGYYVQDSTWGCREMAKYFDTFADACITMLSLTTAATDLRVVLLNR